MKNTKLKKYQKGSGQYTSEKLRLTCGMPIETCPFITKRQKEVYIRKIIQNKKITQIAKELNIRPASVITHLKGLLKKCKKVKE